MEYYAVVKNEKGVSSWRNFLYYEYMLSEKQSEGQFVTHMVVICTKNVGERRLNADTFIFKTISKDT